MILQNKNYKGNICNICGVQVSIGSKLGFCQKCRPKTKHTAESKEKCRISKLGVNNPMFGKTPWNKGVTMESLKGKNNHQWKGQEVSYSGLHNWLYRELGRPMRCQHCDTTTGRLEWANKSQKYIRDLSDWMCLCKKCHTAYDNVLEKGWNTRHAVA